MKDHTPLHDEIRRVTLFYKGGGERLQRDTENTMTAFKKSSSPDLWGHYFYKTLKRDRPPLGDKNSFLINKGPFLSLKERQRFYFSFSKCAGIFTA